MSEPEPRRSVRTTKGQHTKLDEPEPLVPKKRQTKKSKKAQEKQEQEQDGDVDGEDVIRCICGFDQDEDPNEAFIGCETCMVWQHNVCMGISTFDDEIPESYWCERCRPDDHKELLDALKKGEKLWEERRRIHEEENKKKKKKGGRKSKAKRVSDAKEEAEKEAEKEKDKEKETEKEPPKSKAKPSPAPAPEPAPKEKKEPAKGKRKVREDSNDVDPKNAKIRRVSTEPPVQQPLPKYTPPSDLVASISELPSTRMNPAKALKKSITYVMTTMVKNNTLEIPKDNTVDAMAENSALQIERAVFDSHPAAKGQKEYNQQIKSLGFNLKNNPELVSGLIKGTHTPPALAVATSDELASSELQQKTAEMKAKAEKASILLTEDTGPRIRRTHKGEEIVEDDTLISSEIPSQPGGGARQNKDKDQGRAIKHESGHDQVDLSAQSPTGEGSPTQSNFDVKGFFSKVRSPSSSQPRRPSALQNLNTSVDDPDVDRMLQEENDSPPYSPTEDSQDPDVVWRGGLNMSTIAQLQATAKHVAGCDYAKFGPWSDLIPRSLNVAGRIAQQTATEYLCGLRYSSMTEVVVVALEPATPDQRPQFNALIDYFVSKGRYGVVGDKMMCNVRDTYLIPVPPGEEGYPEFILNLMKNDVPMERTENMLLAVFVWRQTASEVPISNGQAGSPTPLNTNAPRSNSASGPGFSPATPQTPFSGPPPVTQTPVPVPQNPFNRPSQPPAPQPSAQAQAPPTAQNNVQAVFQLAPQQPPSLQEQKGQGQGQGKESESEKLAREVLGPELITAAAVQFFLPDSFNLSRREWQVMGEVMKREPRARDDLSLLSSLLDLEKPRDS